MLRTRRGFTLVEVIISLAIFALIASVLFAILIRNQRSARITGNLVEAQQNARVAVDVLARDIRVAGYGADIQNGQPAVQYAGPFEMMFNANVVPYPDTTDPRGNPQALDWNGSNLPPHSRRTPTIQDTTGAETVVYTLDHDMDGSITDQDVFGAQGNVPAKETYNPNDMMLMRHIYGWDGSSRQNVLTSEEIALVRGPLPRGQVIEPLFMYWLDINGDGVADTLYGDQNGDGELSDTEIAALTPLEWPIDEMDLRRISRVTLTATGEMPERDRTYKFNNGYRQIRITSDVAIGSNVVLPATVVQRTISGYVYRDCFENQTGTDPIFDIRIQLGSSIYDLTDANGEFEFVIAPGTYNMWIHRIGYGWYPTTAGGMADTIKYGIDVTGGDTSGVTWYLNSPFGELHGTVFHDTDLDTLYEPPDDSLITDASLEGWRIWIEGPVYDPVGSPPNLDTIFRDVAPGGDGMYHVNVEDNFVMWDSTYRIWVEPLDDPAPFGSIWDTLYVTMPNICDFSDTANIPLVRISPAPICDLYAPSFIRGGELKPVCWHMEDEDDPMDSLRITLEYSLDGRLHWHYAKYQMLGPDTCMRWFVPPSATDRLFLRLTVDDPDTNNEPCVSVEGPLSINYPFMMFPSGLFILRDRVIATKDTLDPAYGSALSEVIQMMPRQVRIGMDKLEEDTARVTMVTGLDTVGVDFTVYWQQDTVATEGSFGDPIYSDSAIWISEYQDPLGDSMIGGAWRFYLWGNYWPVDDTTLTCRISFRAELYCVDDDGINEELVFSTDPLTAPLLYRRPGVDFLEISHIEPVIHDCERLMLRVKAIRFDDERTDADVFLYYNGPSSSYMLTPRVPE